MDRLWSFLETASDQQRLERLEQCRVLESILQSCRQQQQQQQQQREAAAKTSSISSRGSSGWWPFGRHANIISTMEATSCAAGPSARMVDSTFIADQQHHYGHQTAPTLETTPSGIRMLRFFHWRDLPATESPPLNSCLREEHALWACRAVAVGCGKPLTELRDCFDDHGPEKILQVTHGKGCSTTCYEREFDGPEETRQPCQAVQQAVGACVATNLYELQQRVEQRAKQGN